jgi:hypothetical protein
MNSPIHSNDTRWTCFQSDDRLALNLRMVHFGQSHERSQKRCQATARLQPSHFFRFWSPPVLNRRCESDYLMFLGANQVLPFAYEAIMFRIDKVLNRMNIYISETYRDYVSGSTYNVFNCMLELFTMLDNVTGLPHPENGISPQRGGGPNALY